MKPSVIDNKLEILLILAEEYDLSLVLTKEGSLSLTLLRTLREFKSLVENQTEQRYSQQGHDWTRQHNS
jgi:hypothetical protein